MSKLFASNTPGSILTFGELLLRICPDGDGNWLRQNTLPFHVGGAELNVAAALALWGLPVNYFTALPDNHMSAQLTDHLQQKNISTAPIVYTGDRVGLFYLTPGRDMKHNALIYDRAGSAFAGLKPGMVNWDKVLEDISWFHFSAICPAISQNVADVCREVLKACVKTNITVSIDLNYRAKLWQYGKSPLDIMPQLVKHCNLVMGNIWAAETMLGIPVYPDIHSFADKSKYLEESKKISAKIMEQFPACEAVANTFRFDKDDLQYYTSLFDGDNLYISKEYRSAAIIDKVGSGDCFMAGLIYGFYEQHVPQEILEFATAAAFTKLFVMGDSTDKSVDEIKRATSV